jgi:hypothetical protein
MDFLMQRWIVVLACLALPAFGQANRGAEAQIKAAFLYKFGGFVEWPARAFERPDSAFTIGVLGADAVASELEQVVTGRSVQGRPIAVRKLKRGESLAGLHMLFVGGPESARIGDALAAAKGQPLLVVSESEDALSHGSMINFVAVEDKVRFDVALPPAERGQLKISARLLAVARKVISS